QDDPGGVHVAALRFLDDLGDDGFDVAGHKLFGKQGAAMPRALGLAGIAGLKRASARFRRVFSRRHDLCCAACRRMSSRFEPTADLVSVHAWLWTALVTRAYYRKCSRATSGIVKPSRAMPASPVRPTRVAKNDASEDLPSGQCPRAPRDDRARLGSSS